MEEMHGDMMNQKSGIYLVNKPKGITSNDLVQKIKRKFGYKKVGHAGTLDPLATGLMVILVNQATKISTNGQLWRHRKSHWRNGTGKIVKNPFKRNSRIFWWLYVRSIPTNLLSN
jgi:hypothetical protein